jgi:hypothetical protein
MHQPEEYRIGHIAGPKLIRLDNLSTCIEELPRLKEVIVCASGNRSCSATKLLVDAGNSAFDMKRGYLCGNAAVADQEGQCCVTFVDSKTYKASAKKREGLIESEKRRKRSRSFIRIILQIEPIQPL